jgi:predicted  nucleic acid-binding Zn-ribbon protein
MTETKSNNGLKVLAGLLGVVLLGVIIYTVSLYQEKKKTEAVLTQEKSLVEADLTSLKSEYDKAILESNATNEELVSARDNIAKYLDSVKTMKADISSLSRYRRQVGVLKAEREQLLKQVDSLKTSNTLIAMQRDSTYVQLEKQTVFNDSLVVQNTQLADAVEKGSALNLTTFNVDAVKERNSGKLVSTSRSKSTDKLKICFTVANNVIAQAGDREFYLEVLDPQGNVLGESYSKTNDNGGSITYSKGTNFYYENQKLDVCDYINKPAGDFQKGNYMVNIYDDGLKLLGNVTFGLK